MSDQGRWDDCRVVYSGGMNATPPVMRASMGSLTTISSSPNSDDQGCRSSGQLGPYHGVYPRGYYPGWTGSLPRGLNCDTPPSWSSGDHGHGGVDGIRNPHCRYNSNTIR